MDAKAIGEQIKCIRKERGLTQAELAQMVDIAPKYLSNIECGIKVPRFETFIEIANALMVDANTLLVDVLEVSTNLLPTQICQRINDLPPEDQKRLYTVVNLFLESRT